MTETMDKNQDMELLSQLLDELNAGQQPESEDPELAELVAVAAMLKQTGPVVRPPQHLVDQTVDKILADQADAQPKPQKRSWFWRNPGILGAAASLLLVVGLQLYPSWNSPEVQTVSAPAAVVEKREVAPPTQPAADGVEKTPVVVSRQPSPAPVVQEKASETPAERPPVAADPQPLNPSLSNSDNSRNSIANPTGPAAQETTKKAPVLKEQAPATNEKTTIFSERAATVNKSGSAFKAAAVMIDDPADRWPLPILSLPGQIADDLSRDPQTGTVRQVFWKGTPQEVIVTQRMLRQEEKAANPSTLTGSIEDKVITVNSVTVIMYNQEVTVEGSRSEQELRQIAKQLIL